MSDYIPKDELKIGAPYHVSARNFEYALWDGKAFAGVRYKFGSFFIDHELHWDDGSPHGTVKPLQLLEQDKGDRDG